MVRFRENSRVKDLVLKIFNSYLKSILYYFSSIVSRIKIRVINIIDGLFLLDRCGSNQFCHLEMIETQRGRK